MPTYDYLCGQCEHQFEEFQLITAKPLTKCPKCKKGRVKRLMGTGGGILFKGSGFYQTDYRSAKYQAAAKGDKPGCEGKTPCGAGHSEAKGD